MARSIRGRVWDLLQSRRNRMRIIAVVACVAALMSVIVAARLSQVAVTLTHRELVLVCPYDGDGAHTHDSSCYDEDGRLVCPLEERELHTHDASCYDEDGELICGKEEITDVHVHGAGCFMDANLIPMPEQSFAGTAGNVIVCVEAPEGAFPEGATMNVEAVDGQAMQGAVGMVLPDDFVLDAVDITFHNAMGNVIEPRVPVKVTMTSTTNPTKAKPVVVHVSDDGAVNLVVQKAPNSLNKAIFESDSFSVYVMAVKRLQQTLTASDGRTYDISVTYTEAARIPDDAELVVREIDETDSSFASVFGRAKDAATSAREDATVTNARFFDISLKKGGATLEPLAPVEVNIVLTSGIGLSDATSVVHFVNTRKVEIVDAEAAPVDEQSDIGVDVTFTTNRFSVFGIMEMTLEKRVLASDGQLYHISVTYSTDAGVPADAELMVDEIVEPEDGEGDEASAYRSYVTQVADALGWSPGSIPYARLFDIRIVDRAGNKVELSAPVSVQVELEDYAQAGDDISTQVMHFADDAAVPDMVYNVAVDGDTVSFKADGFSVYAIVQAPEPAEYEVETVASLAELDKDPSTAFFLSVQRDQAGPYYFTNALNNNKCLVVVKNPIAPTASSYGAGEWFFEKGEASGTYLLWTMVDGQKRYLNNPSDKYVGLVDTANKAVPLEISVKNDGTFEFKKAGANLWLQYSNGGGGIRFWNDNKTPLNARITISLASSYQPEDDPYKLNGTTYGIAYHNDTAKSTSLSTNSMTVGSEQRLGAIDMLMREDTVSGSGLLLVAEGQDITEWTFECVKADTYHITTTVDGAKKYLTIKGKNVTLSNNPDADGAIIQMVPGTGEYAGRYSLNAGAYALNLPAGDTDGFNGVTGNGATKWMNLVNHSSLQDEDFRLYTSKKASASDTESVTNGKQVVLYARVWNEAIERYEFYVVDHDGSLQRCYDVGDAIEWIGNKRNSALWEFTEYSEGGAPTYFYELKNAQYGNYIAPLLKDAKGNPQILSPEKPGLNLNGRRYGHDYTTIIAWDDVHYEYVGLKVREGKLVPCPLSEAEDFYFALAPEHSSDDKLTEVKTVDGSLYGIEMKMIDFNNGISNNRDRGQASWFGEDYHGGLLDTNLGADGYPTASSASKKPGQSLAGLFNNMTPVNHLFIQSVYNESGYFEYDSTQNFARLNSDGTFTVYDQIGAITGRNEAKPTRTHGQFMPYNDIEAGNFAKFKNGEYVTNQTDVLKNPLADTNPRKGEKLYLIGDEDKNTANYFFGMEMSASFTQTPSGLDAWGHDIVFEFSGDDDFWFYVDGELVLDLGGVHEAETGDINFKTGVVTYTLQGESRKSTSLYEVFTKNYQKRGLSETEIAAKLAEIFTQNSDGQYVFNDYSSHTMRMFYMERGAGASNLHMRFNLAAVRPGTFQLSKKLSGAESESNSLAEFPYQVFYYTEGDGATTPHQLTDASKVVYEGTANPVKHAETFTPAGGTEPYENVFFLKPGEKVEVELPQDIVSYYVVECGVNPQVYDKVSANGTVLEGDESENVGRIDYAVAAATLNNRSSVEYDNHVSADAVRTLNITKRLWDQGGQNPLPYPTDTTPFTLRLYLGSENDSAENLPLANMYPYHVKDAEGTYCRWDAATGTFASLGKSNLADLTEDERASATFTTSMYGTISYIPADHTVEVRNLIAGTQFKVEERANEIPRGYTLRQLDGYSRVDDGHEETTQDRPYAGTIATGETPKIEVRNQKGWGLTVKKDWTDRDFMSSREPAYFGVFLDGALVDGSVRQLTYGQNEIYYFFESLERDKKFDDYVIQEVVVTPGDNELSVDSTGKVSGFASATPVAEGETIEINGVATGDTESQSYKYRVDYEKGDPTLHNENVRTDTVTNSRPGIELVKRDIYGNLLSGAVFTLKNAKGQDVSAASYTSGNDGRITVAYLAPGTYTLTEISVPKGFVALPAPLTIEVRANGTVEVSGVDKELFELKVHTEKDATMLATITVKNRPGSFQIMKVDADTQTPLSGVTFALYPQVNDGAKGKPMKDYYPVPGYESIVTDENGVLTGIDGSLPAKTYYLTETHAVTDYDLLTEDICFTMGEDGTVTINDPDQASWLKPSASRSGKVSYLIEIPNSKQKVVSFKKVDVANVGASALEGAEFDLYRVVGGERAKLYSLVSNKKGMLVNRGWDMFRLAAGTYHLVETKAPDGYILKADPVVITVTPEHVTYDEGTALSSNGKGVVHGNNVYTLLISNSTGFELPSTGSSETITRAFLGASLVLGGAVVLFWHRRRLMDER